MRTFLSTFAIVAIATTPATAQTAPAEPDAAKVKMVKKTVCERVANEATTGSRLGSGKKKVCKTVEVPAEEADQKAQGTQPQGHGAHAH